MDASGRVRKALGREGWHLQPEAVEATWRDMREMEMVPTKILEDEELETSVRAELLDTDLKKIGEPCLPDARSLQQLNKLHGPMVLQLLSISNVAESTRKSYTTGHQNNRLLRLRLTDGHTSVTAIEHHPIDCLSENIPPGTKVLLRGIITLHSGILMLDAQSIRILGGHVKGMHEAWEIERKYSGLARSAAVKGVPDGGSGPPPFRGLKSNTVVPLDPSSVYQESPRVLLPVAADVGQPDAALSEKDLRQAGHSPTTKVDDRAMARIKPGSEPYKPRSAQAVEVPAGGPATNLHPGTQAVTGKAQTPSQPECGVHVQGPLSSSLAAARQIPAGKFSGRKSTSPRKTTYSEENERVNGSKTVLPPGSEAAPVQNRAAAQKLLERKVADERSGRPQRGFDRESAGAETRGRCRGRGGRGRGRGRFGRGGDEEEGDGVLTWDEWEAKKSNRSSYLTAGSYVSGTSPDTRGDEDLARRLQERLDLETMKVQKTSDDAEQLRLSMFNFAGDNQDIEDNYVSRGRGRGRGRGSRGGRRGRAYGHQFS